MRINHVRSVATAAILATAIMALSGCHVDSFLDPSRTGRFENTPTTIPVLQRIDVIEGKGAPWGETTQPLPDDLVPNDLAYRIASGDLVTVDIYELYNTGEWYQSARVVDAAGNYRVPVLGDLQAAGLTAQELEDSITRQLAVETIVEPRVDIIVERGGAFRYTVFGRVENPGMYNLTDPGLRLLDALANTGRVPEFTEQVFIIRSVPLSEQYKRPFDRGVETGPGQPDANQGEPPVDVEDLIDQLGDGTSPGMLQDQDAPPVDIDMLEPARITDPADVDVQDVEGAQQSIQPGPTGGFFYDQERGEWVRIPRTGAGRQGSLEIPSGTPSDALVLERIIEIDYQRLSRGDSSLNIVVRPNDRIHVAGKAVGVVYVDGEVARPGVYNLPVSGDLTLSRLIAASGGLGSLAIPERVDLTRKVATDREATIRVDLAAIRNRTQPDVVLKPDDHIIVGTNFWALPLAVIRSGFRVTYGFGFLLDRNFGNDVFGAPPVNRLN